MRLGLHLALMPAVVALLMPRVSYQWRSWLVRWWSRRLLKVLGVRLVVKGEVVDWLAPNLVIAANHISWLDIFVINSVRPTRFVAKSDIRDWPIVGWLCERAGTIFISRSKRSDTLKINDVIHDVLGHGDCIGLFPEATTTAGDVVRTFHSSLFEPAVANRARVAPAAIRYFYRSGERSIDPAYIDDITLGMTIDRIIAQRHLSVEVTFCPMLVDANATRRYLARAAETAIAEVLQVPISRQKLALGGGGLSATTTQFD